MNLENDEDRLEDLLQGAAEIAAYLGWTMSKTHHAIRDKKIPFGRIGAKSIVASKRALREHFEKITAGVSA